MRPKGALAYALLPLLAAGCIAPPGSQLPVPDRLTQLNSLIGAQMLVDEGAWSPTEDHLVLGLDWAEHIDGLPVRIEGGLHYSWDETKALGTSGQTIEVRHALYEFSAGFLATPWPRDALMRPYLGAGGSIVYVDFDATDDDSAFEDHDTTYGGYLKAGLLLRVHAYGHLGVEYRMFRGADVSVNGVEADTDYETVAIVFGSTIR